MCIQVIMFEGGESVDQAKQTHMITEWSKEAVLKLICQHHKDWANNEHHDCFGEDTPIRDSLDEAVPDRLFCGILEAVDGGHIYVVKVSP